MGAAIGRLTRAAPAAAARAPAAPPQPPPQPPAVPAAHVPKAPADAAVTSGAVNPPDAAAHLASELATHANIERTLRQATISSLPDGSAAPDRALPRRLPAEQPNAASDAAPAGGRIGADELGQLLQLHAHQPSKWDAPALAKRYDLDEAGVRRALGACVPYRVVVSEADGLRHAVPAGHGGEDDAPPGEEAMLDTERVA